MTNFIAETVWSPGLVRPSNSIKYTAGDLIADAQQAPLVFAPRGTGWNAGGRPLLRAVTIIRHSAATDMGFRLWLFAAPPSRAGVQLEDNKPLRPGPAALESLLGYVSIAAEDFIALGDQAAACVSLLAPVPIHGERIYGLLEARNAVAMGSGETIGVALAISPV